MFRLRSTKERLRFLKNEEFTFGRLVFVQRRVQTFAPEISAKSSVIRFDANCRWSAASALFSNLDKN